MRCLLPVLLLLTACASAPRAPTQTLPEARLGEEFTLEQEGGISLAGTPYYLIFSTVLEDSRCPAGVACVWEGNARVRISVSDSSKPVEIHRFLVTLNTSARVPTEGNEGDLVLELRRLSPEPKAGVQTEGYTVTLVATKK